MNIKKKLLCVLTIVLLLCNNMSLIVSANAGLQASPVFVTKSVGLTSSMTGNMTCTTSVLCKKIYISAVTLERKSGNSWVDPQSVPCPTATVTNDNSLGASKAYASYCTTGNTYRITVTFNADGVTATATSGGIAYK